MHINEANIANLTGLWKKYNSQVIKSSLLTEVHVNIHWPHRCWFDWDNLSREEILQTLQPNVGKNTLLENVPVSAVIPVWPMMGIANGDECSGLFEQQLLDNQWGCAFEQTAMYLVLKETREYLALEQAELQVKTVLTQDDVGEWVDIASDAFAYSINGDVIERLIDDKDIKILLGCHNEQAVASALLYKTDDIIGIHQVGVRQSFQGKGIARWFMQNIIETCAQWQGEYIVLQASHAGKSLYDSLGFKAQFLIKNYQIV